MMISSRFWFAVIMCVFAHVVDDYFRFISAGKSYQMPTVSPCFRIVGESTIAWAFAHALEKRLVLAFSVTLPAFYPFPAGQSLFGRNSIRRNNAEDFLPLSINIVPMHGKSNEKR